MSIDLEKIPTVGEGVKRLADDAESSPVLERLRAQYEKVKADKTRDFDIPGWDGLLIARYRRLDGDVTDKMAADADSLTAYNVAFLVEACEELFSREKKDAPLKPLSDDYPVTYGELGPLFGFDAEDAGDALVKVFDGHDLVIRNHGDDVANWMIGNAGPDLGK